MCVCMSVWLVVGGMVSTLVRLYPYLKTFRKYTTATSAMMTSTIINIIH